jgi:hypothetical protein
MLWAELRIDPVLVQRWLFRLPTQFQLGDAAIPDLAPKGESHLLGSTSVVQLVTYGHDRVTYRTYDADAVDALRLNFRPKSVESGGRSLIQRRTIVGQGYTLQVLGGGSYVLRVHHLHNGNVTVAD